MGLLNDGKSAATIAEEKLELIYDLEDAGKIDPVSNLESAAAGHGNDSGSALRLNKADPHHAGAGGLVEASEDKFNISRGSDQKSL